MSLHPHCTTKDQLLIWHPAQAQVLQQPLQQEDMQHLRDVLPHTWADSTKEMYGLGLLAFHTFCDFKSILEPEQAPVAEDMMSAFIAHLAGAYTSSTVVNYVSVVQAWHAIHGLEWCINEREADLLYKATWNLAPPTAKWPAREPYTLGTIASIRTQLDLTSPLHMAVFTCLTTTFFTAAHTGEFMIPNLKAFNSAHHITQAGISIQHDWNGLQVTCFRLPWTKKSPIGEEVNWAKQTGPHDLEEAFSNHLRINNPSDTVPLFAYCSKLGFVPLTRSKFLKVLDTAMSNTRITPLKGYGIRIGATLEYLLCKIPFNVVKVRGRWARDSFLIYLRKHAQILAPYMQENPEVHATFLQHTIPPIRRRG